jgi:hypothetical protein
MGRITVSNEEFRTVRDAMRELNRMVDALDRGEETKFVLTHRNRMRAVVVSLDTFSAMQQQGGSLPSAGGA